jgi:Uma2 family endonuclease
MYEPIPPRPARETLPTMYDLPSEEVGDPGLPDEFHRKQANFLSETCLPPNIEASKVFTASDLNLYYDPRHTNWYKRPDWYLVLGVAPEWENDLRWSYVVWQEGVRPFLMVELLSPGTEAEDLGETLRDASKPPAKWEVYEQILSVPYYVVYDRYENNLRFFRLNGCRYQEVSLPEKRIWFEELELGLGLWQGIYQGSEHLWLRWYDANSWIPTQAERAKAESQMAEAERQRAEAESQRAEAERQRAEAESQRAEAERQRAEAERQRAEAERQRAERLGDYLRSQGIDPDNLPL